jgi:hypothetical protein
MPNPIVPIHKQNDYDQMFGGEPEVSGLSDIQQQLLGPRTAAKKTYSSQTLSLLERIYKSKDEVLSSANSYLERTAEVSDIYSVPGNISDYDLLGLKTEGVIVGSGRAVKITEAGRTALRDHWLKSQNDKKINRESPRFDYKSALNKLQSIKSNNEDTIVTASSKGRFKQG